MLTLTQSSPIQRANVATDLTKRAMNVRLVINRWDAQRTDKTASRTVAKEHNVEARMGRYQKFLIDPEALEPINKLCNQIRAEHYARTVPFMDGGNRVLLNEGYFEYLAVMNRLRSLLDDAKRDLIAKYPQLVAEAKVALGTLWEGTEYPTAEELDNKFGAHYRISNIANADHFMVKLSADEVERIRAQIEQDTHEAIAAANQDVWERLQKPVQAMAERLASYNVQGDRVTGVFRDSLVENIREIVDLVPSLNIAQDEALEMFAERCREKLLAHDAQTLRVNPHVRSSVAAEAEKIASMMSDFV